MNRGPVQWVGGAGPGRQQGAGRGVGIEQNSWTGRMGQGSVRGRESCGEELRDWLKVAVQRAGLMRGRSYPGEK